MASAQETPETVPTSNYYSSWLSAGNIAGFLALVGENTVKGNTQAVFTSKYSYLPRILPAPQALLGNRPVEFPSTTTAKVCHVQSGSVRSHIPFPISAVLERHRLKPFEVRCIQLFEIPAFEGSDHNAPLLSFQPVSPAGSLELLGVLASVALLAGSIVYGDGMSAFAVLVISCLASIVGLVNTHTLTRERQAKVSMPDCRVVIRYPNGSFMIVKCNEATSREIFFKTETIRYKISNPFIHRLLSTLGTVLMMIGIIAIANARPVLQAAWAIAYIAINIAYGLCAMFPQSMNWQLRDHVISEQSLDGGPYNDNFTEALWKSIVLTRSIGWVKSSQSAPDTESWKAWLEEALSRATSEQASSRKGDLIDPLWLNDLNTATDAVLRYVEARWKPTKTAGPSSRGQDFTETFTEDWEERSAAKPSLASEKQESSEVKNPSLWTESRDASTQRSSDGLIWAVPEWKPKEHLHRLLHRAATENRQFPVEPTMSIEPDRSAVELDKEGKSFSEALRAQERDNVKQLLRSRWDVITHDIRWSWLRDVSNLGYDADAIADLLLMHERDGPWIEFEPFLEIKHRMLRTDFHVDGCAHSLDKKDEIRATEEGDQVEVEVVRRDHAEPMIETSQVVASLCGLAGIVPSPEEMDTRASNVVFEKTPAFCASVTYETSNVLDLCESALRAFCTAVAEAQERGSCCNEYPILCRSKSDAAELCDLDLTIPVQLLALLESRHGSDESGREEEVKVNSAYWARVKDLSMEIILTIPEDLSVTSLESALRRDRGKSSCALAVQILCLSFVAYHQSFVGPLDLFFLEQGLQEIRLYGTEPISDSCLIEVKLQKLSCLGDMLESPVLVFGRETYMYRSTNELGVIASPEQLLCLWGPGTIFPASTVGSVARPPCVVLGGGAIYPTTHERYFHWSSVADMASDSTMTSIDPKLRVQVGAMLEAGNGQCSQQLAAVRAKNASYRRPLGTCDPFWMHDVEREAGGSAGMYVMPQFVTKSQKNWGISLKKRLLDSLRSHRLDPAFLESTSGLQVSLCSGFARRVKIRDLLADLLPQYAERYLHHYPDWTILQQTFDIEQQLRQTNAEELLRRIAATNARCLRTLCDLTEGLMTTLQPTGIDATGKEFIVALFPTEVGAPIECLKSVIDDANSWTSVLQDTSSTCTFAYFTPLCLQLSGYGCRFADVDWHGRVYFLETEVHRHFDSVSTRYEAQTGPWTLMNGHTYAIGPKGGIPSLIWMSVALQAKVVRPQVAEDARLIVKRSPIPAEHLRRIMLRPLMGRLQERLGPGGDLVAQRAFIMSHEDKRLVFH